MARKKSAKRAAATFKETTARISEYLEEVKEAKLSDQAMTWCYEAAIVKTSIAFEKLMLECLVTAVNNDTSTISAVTGRRFPKHLTDEVCEWLIIGDGYFDFKGRDGLIKTIKRFVPDDHYLRTIVSKTEYRKPLDLLIALRNYAAHESPQSKVAAQKQTGAQRLGSAGAWAKSGGYRYYNQVIWYLDALADEIAGAAKY